MLKIRKRLGDLLLESGRLTPDQLDRGLSLQKKTGDRLGKILIDLGYMTEESMMAILAYQLGLIQVDLADMAGASELTALVPLSLAERYHVVPVRKEGRKLILAMVDPTNFFAMDDIRMATGCEVEPVIAAEKDIYQAIHQAYGVRERVEQAVQRLRANERNEPAVAAPAEESTPVVSIVNSLISQAVRERASDIHIEPQEQELCVRLRIDGLLREVVRFPRHTQAAIISRLKIMSELDITEKRLPQDGRIRVQEAGRDIDIRVSVLPTITGEKVVLRILDRDAMALQIDHLGFNALNLARYQQLYRHAYGMILLTGPTGSGKTTTLYSTLREVSTPQINVITVEDPIEYRLEGISQVQVNPKIGLDFAEGLRSILRQDPNVIMVGEIRDTETADIAIRAALTGHLVFSTLHTNNAVGAVSRLLDMGAEPFLVASALRGVVAQRLVRMICPDCRESYTPDPAGMEREFVRLGRADDVTLFRGRGCPACGMTGYRGRMAIQEVMTVSVDIRDAIQRRENVDQLSMIAGREGMVLLRQDGIAKALAGQTSIAEVMRVAYEDF